MFARKRLQTPKKTCEVNDTVQNKDKTRQDNTRQDKTHTLCEPAQSKCIPTCHKKHFIRKFAGKMLQARMSPERRHKLCASLRSRNASQHFTTGTLYGNLQKQCRGPAGSQKRDPHCVRACAVEMHVNISEKQLYTEIYR